jgi:hypothetical protein
MAFGIRARIRSHVRNVVGSIYKAIRLCISLTFELAGWSLPKEGKGKKSKIGQN